MAYRLTIESGEENADGVRGNMAGAPQHLTVYPTASKCFKTRNISVSERRDEALIKVPG
jgi:hypothetical protein